MPFRIAFDMDGVLADMDGAVRREASRLGIGADAVVGRQDQVPSGDAAPPPKARSDRDQRRLWAEISQTENFWETLDELDPGSIRRLDALAVACRWEVLFITTRPPTAGATVQRQTQHWLERCGFRLPSVYVVSGSRGKVASALDLDVVVDDRPENCVDVKADSEARAILVLSRSNETVAGSGGRPLAKQALHLGIGVVASVGECLDVLESLESSDGGRVQATRTDRISRLARQLGLGSRPPGKKSA